MTLKSKCHFVSDAKDAIDANKMVEIELNQLRLVQKATSKKIQDTNPSKVAEYIKKYYMVLEKKILRQSESH